MLRNLDLKASALDDLDLPVKVLAGHLGEQKYPCGVSIIFKLLSVVGVGLGIFLLNLYLARSCTYLLIFRQITSISGSQKYMLQ